MNIYVYYIIYYTYCIYYIIWQEKLTSMEGEFEDLKRQIKENDKRITEKVYFVYM